MSDDIRRLRILEDELSEVLESLYRSNVIGLEYLEGSKKMIYQIVDGIEKKEGMAYNWK
ncbi:MAG: hypothetical protein HY518_01135 [Candidatus Aenigmarchaeota archaeon]|nr:hypothetical protein [Candidatus Aenigmarchaeota archaeon]